MKNKNLVLLFLLLMVEGGLLSAAAQSKSSVYKPWSHGQLKVSKENRYLMNADGTPFFWLGSRNGYPLQIAGTRLWAYRETTVPHLPHRERH